MVQGVSNLAGQQLEKTTTSLENDAYASQAKNEMADAMKIQNELNRFETQMKIAEKGPEAAKGLIK